MRGAKCGEGVLTSFDAGFPVTRGAAEAGRVKAGRAEAAPGTASDIMGVNDPLQQEKTVRWQGVEFYRLTGSHKELRNSRRVGAFDAWRKCLPKRKQLCWDLGAAIMAAR